jgi:hypothetical protein
MVRIEKIDSFSRFGHFHDHSGIDIAVVGTDAATYFALWRDLEAACPGWCIDLREMNQPSHFTDTVRQVGELVYESSSTLMNCDAFVMFFVMPTLFP